MNILDYSIKKIKIIIFMYTANTIMPFTEVISIAAEYAELANLIAL